MEVGSAVATTSAESVNGGARAVTQLHTQQTGSIGFKDP